MEHRNPQDAFNDAIVSGLLSRDEKATNFAGNYMYMHTIDGKDCFKNIITRKYI